MNPEDVSVAKQPASAATGPPNILYFHVDNLGYGGAGLLRRRHPARRSHTAHRPLRRRGTQLLNFAPESPVHAVPFGPDDRALRHPLRQLTGRNWRAAGRSGGVGADAWATSSRRLATPPPSIGKWHIGDEPGRWPTDHGFDEWYGMPHTLRRMPVARRPLVRPRPRPDARPCSRGAKGEPVPRSLSS